MDNADTEKYQIIPVYITRDGRWYTGDKLRDMSFISRFSAKDVQRCFLAAEPGAQLSVRHVKGFKEKLTHLPCHVAVLAMHGMHGEDGTLQGLLELADIPYTSCGVGASSGGMDKIAMKHVFRGVGLPVLPDISFTREKIRADMSAAVKKVREQVGYPVFVKPACLGSSIGISRTDDDDALITALQLACYYDRRILVEKAAENPREVNCSAMGIGENVRVSAIEEPLRAQDFLSFSDKYLANAKGSSGMKSLKRKLPADIPQDVADKVREYTQKAFMALDCKGVVRVDYLLDEKGQLFINEINTIPGSFSFYLWEPEGIDFSRLIDELVQMAFQAADEKKRNQYAFDSNILKQYGKGSKGTKGAKSR